MPRARKALLEGEEVPDDKIVVGAGEHFAVINKAPKERPSKGFRAAIDTFRKAHPEMWDEIALCPTQHGVEIIAEHLEKL